MIYICHIKAFFQLSTFFDAWLVHKKTWHSLDFDTSSPPSPLSPPLLSLPPSTIETASLA